MGPFARAGRSLDRFVTAVGARIPYEPPSRRRIWIAVVIFMAIAPAVFAASRQAHFSSSVVIYPRPVGPFPAVHDIRRCRVLLRDPYLRNKVAETIETGPSAYRELKIKPSTSQQTFIMTLTRSTPNAAKKVLDVMALELAYASGRQVVNDATLRARALRAQLRSVRAAAARRTVLRRRLARLRQLASPRAADAARELRLANSQAATETRLRRELTLVQRVIRAPANRFVAGGPAPRPKLTRWADHVVDALPGPFPSRPSPFWAGVAGLALATLLWVTCLRLAPPRRRPEELRPTAPPSREVAVLARVREGSVPVTTGNPGTLPKARRGAHVAQQTQPPIPHRPAPVAALPPDELEAHEWARQAFERLRASHAVPVACFALAGLAAGIYIMGVSRHAFFRADDWDMLVNRRGLTPTVLFTPHAEHLIAAQAVFFDALRGVAGWHYETYRLVMVLLHLAITSCVFVFARRRVGPWLALVMVLPLLVLGAGAEGLWWAGVLGFNASLAAGIGTLLILERMRPTRLQEAAVFALLVVAVASFTYGVVFAIAAAIWMVATPRLRRSLWVALVPLVAYGAWKLAYPGPPFAIGHVKQTPRFVFESLAAALGAFTGFGLEWGRVLAVGAAAAAGYVLVKRPRRSVSTFVIVAVPLALWAVTGFGRAAAGPTVQAVQPRYVYAGVVATLLAAAELLAGRRLRWGAAVIGLVVVTGVVHNIGRMQDGGDFFRDRADVARAYIGAIEVAHPAVSPRFGASNLPNPDYVRAVIGYEFETGRLDKAVRAIGSEPVNPRVLDRLSADKRIVVDQVLVRALRLRLVTVTRGRPSPALTARVCTLVRPAERGREFALRGPGVVAIRTGSRRGIVSVRRYAAAAGAAVLGTVPPSVTQYFTIPQDRSARPWYTRVASGATVRVCRTGGLDEKPLVPIGRLQGS